MTSYIALYGDSAGADRARCAAAARFLERRAALSSAGESAGRPPAAGAAGTLLDLAARDLLSFEPGEADGSVDVWYTPSRESVEAVHEAGDDSGFPSPVHKKQLKSFRSSRGAIFTFPAAGGDGAVEVFITDWSPCPVACAVAVHPDHSFLAGAEIGPAPSFGGRFVRHPLTGDLLPVWVAGWVKPHFGTGAVLVNPAHDPTDLEFARRSGLPIRFGLVPEGFDGSPETWPEPPIVRTGRSIRTGPYDGLSAQEARERYFEVLSERGLAREHTDLQAGRFRVAVLAPDAEGELAWDGRRRRLARAGDEDAGDRMAVTEGDLLTAAGAAVAGSSPGVVAPAAEQAEALLGLRLLHRDLAGRPLEPSEVQLVQKVQGGPDDLPPEVERLGLLVGAPLDQVVSIKQQVVDQATKFLKVHEELLAGDGGGGADGAEEAPSKQLLEVRAALDRGDTARAFATLYRMQKQLAGGGGGERDGYFACVHVLAGLDSPSGHDLARAWGRLGERD